MKQSSIEWLIENLHLHNDVYFVTKNKRDIIKQAKAMHKEELLDTWEDSRIEYMGDDYIGETKSFDDYYNETFNTQKK